jgi:hypothetical protein
MHIHLRKEVFELLKDDIGKTIKYDDFDRIGRNEYSQILDNSYLFKILFNDEHEIKQVAEKMIKDDYNGEYQEFQNSIQEFIDKKINEIKDYSYFKSFNSINSKGLYFKNTEIKQHLWIKENKIIASGFSISSFVFIPRIIEQLFYITDKFGEPSFEDTKTIEWKFDNDLKTIIILPKKITKDEKNIVIIVGKYEYLENTDIWKTNI